MKAIFTKEFVSTKEIIAYLGVGKTYFHERLKPLRPFLNGNGKRKRFYTQEEFRFIRKNLAKSV